MEKIIKSKQRVKEHAEVYTPSHIVENMLALIPLEEFKKPLSTFLEPACGNGNFLVAILERKLSHSQGDPEVYALKVLSSIYGVDIQQDNVEESIERLLAIVDMRVPTSNKKSFLAVAESILKNNIQLGNTLKPEDLVITQYFWTGAAYSTVKIPFKDIS